MNAAIRDRMSKQEGQISYLQLLEAGLTPAGVRRRVASGSLVLQTGPAASRRPVKSSPTKPTSPKARGSSTKVYAAHGGNLSAAARRWRAVLSGPEPSLMTGVSVCELLGLDRPSAGPMHVVHLGGGWNAPEGVVGHRTVFLPPRDRAVSFGLPRTTLSRAFLDAAANLAPDRLDDLLDTAVRTGLYDGDQMLQVLSDRPTFTATLRLTEAIGRLDATSGTFRSNFERRTVRLVERSSRIGVPVINVLVDGFRPDLRWWGTRAIVECDGRDYHRSPAQIASDEAREMILRARGFVFLRLRWHQVVYEEERTLDRIERFVLANAEPPVAMPST